MRRIEAGLGCMSSGMSFIFLLNTCIWAELMFINWWALTFICVLLMLCAKIVITIWAFNPNNLHLVCHLRTGIALPLCTSPSFQVTL